MITAQEAAQEVISRRAARASFPGFCKYRLPEEQTMADHHIMVAQALDKVERGEVDKLAIMLPPGSAKSTYGSMYFPEYFMGKNPQLSVIAASHTLELAERFGRRVRNAFGDDTHRVLFNNGVVADNAAAGRWATTQGGEYFAVGVGGSVTGRRADLGIIDDPVRSREDADSDLVRNKTWDWYTNDFLTRLKPGGRIVILCTRWHEDDLLGRILEREASEWMVIKIPMLAMENDVLGREPGERLWPEWYTEKMVEQAQKDPRSWISLYQQEPRPKDGAEFKRSWISRYNTAPKILNKILIVDPAGDPNRANKAGTKRKKSDRTVMWVIGLASDGNAYIVDGLIDRLNLTQRVDALFDLHRKHKPIQTRYEQYGLQADIESANNEMERRQYRFKIIEVGGRVEKNARIRRLIPWFEGGRIWVPQSLKKTTVLGEEIDLIDEFIEVEYSTFPVGRFDDGLDCLARMCEPDLKLPFPDDRTPQALDPDNYVGFKILDQLTGY